MAGLNDVKNSPYLAKEDFPKPQLVTIRGHKKENVAREGDPEEMKVIMYFNELPKGLRLNMTNSRAVLQVCGLPETADFDGCNGHQITLYNDVNVMMGNERKGGIRVYIPQQQIEGLPNQGVPGQVYPVAGQVVVQPNGQGAGTQGGNPNNAAPIQQAMDAKGIQYGTAPENSREADGDGPPPTF